MTPRFEIRRDPVPCTYGGLFGGKADEYNTYVLGEAHYLVDGKEVSKSEYERLWTEAQRATLFPNGQG